MEEKKEFVKAWIVGKGAKKVFIETQGQIFQVKEMKVIK